MISYKEYIRALPALTYAAYFHGLLEARINIYLADNPALLPESSVVSDEPDSYRLAHMEPIEAMIKGDIFPVGMMSLSVSPFP